MRLLPQAPLAVLVAALAVACVSRGGARPVPARGDAFAARTGGNEETKGERVSAPAAELETEAAAGSAQDPALDRARVLLEEARAAKERKDPAAARAKAAEAIEVLLSQGEDAESQARVALLVDLGMLAHNVGDLKAARRAREKVLEAFSRTLPEDHLDLQKARGNLAVTIKAQGDLHSARALQEKVLEVFSRTLPEDHPDLQRARQGLAGTIYSLGDLHGARALAEKVLEVFSRTLPEDHPDLQKARGNLAATIADLGDLQGARSLQERVLEVRSRTLPEDHPDLQLARGNLAVTIKAQGDLQGARALQERVLEVNSRTLPEDHPNLQLARNNLAGTIADLGDLQGARSLQERVLEVRSRTLPEDHPDLQLARLNLAATIADLGDLQGARALQERVLEVNSRTLPEDHPHLQRARQDLAGTIYCLGDLQGARALFEKVLEVNSRTLPEDHPNLQRTRGNLAATIYSLGDLQGARVLFEKVLEVRSRTLPEDHPNLQLARGNLAVTIKAQGDLQGARALEELVLEVFSRTLPEDHPNVQLARGNLAATIVSQSGRDRRGLGGEGEKREERAGARERCADLVRALCQAQVQAAREALLKSSSREAEERCTRLAEKLGPSISFAGGYGVFEPIADLDRESLVLSETTRGAALGSAALMRAARGSPRYEELRTALRQASDELAALAQKGTTSDEFQRALQRRDDVERELVHLARTLSGGAPIGLDFDVAELAARLTVHDAVVGLRRYTRWWVELGETLDSTGNLAIEEKSVESLCAFVLRPSATAAHGDAGTAAGSDRSPSAERVGDRFQLTRVELGPVSPIEEAVHAWRESLGAAGGSRGVSVAAARTSSSRSDEHGTRLRQLVFDPLLAALQGAEHLVVVFDDVLHLMPLDALPAEDVPSIARGERPLLGDRWRIETRVTLAELLAPPVERSPGGELLAVGDVSYGSLEEPESSGQPARTSEPRPLEQGGEPVAAVAFDAGAPGSAEAIRRGEDAGLLRGGAWSAGFDDLPGTGAETRGIAQRFREQFGEQEPVTLLKGAGATREKLLEMAPRARWLHVATHGWFATESIKSWSDLEPIDKKSGLGVRLSGLEQVKGMSPMLLCGLALAGANLPENALGRVPGLVTAEELSALDLTRCELVVLSACDTNVGERRAGQGVASLQKALQMAGARSVITSLWKVPDEATQELMLDFYRRLWVDKKPKWQALWEAKKKLRDAKDERGQPKYSLRDWAAWVLTGDPN